MDADGCGYEGVCKNGHSGASYKAVQSSILIGTLLLQQSVEEKDVFLSSCDDRSEMITAYSSIGLICHEDPHSLVYRCCWGEGACYVARLDAINYHLL